MRFQVSKVALVRNIAIFLLMLYNGTDKRAMKSRFEE